MKKALFVGIAGLLGLGACDTDPAGSGDDSGTTTGSSTSGVTPTAGETLTTVTPTATTEVMTSSTTSAESSSSGVSPETTTTATTTDSGSESSSSSTGGEPTITPCQPEMSSADIQRWTSEADSHMPTLGELVLPLVGMTAQAAPGGGLSDVPDPQAGGGFITDPDGGGVTVACDVWEQDCDEGEKCAAWANDGSSSWNATRCVPVAADPVGVGETCTVEGSGVSGIDTCDAESMCWDVDGETNEGTCVALCEGSEASPTCAPEGTACSIANNGVLILCLPICNPLADECDDGQGCYPVGGYFQCAPDVGGGTEPGDPCEFVNACEDGTGCVNPAIVPGCPAGSAGCCSSFCDPLADEPACLDGQECLPWYEVGDAPDACLDAVGICSTPA